MINGKFRSVSINFDLLRTFKLTKSSSQKSKHEIQACNTARVRVVLSCSYPSYCPFLLFLIFPFQMHRFHTFRIQHTQRYKKKMTCFSCDVAVNSWKRRDDDTQKSANSILVSIPYSLDAHCRKDQEILELKRQETSRKSFAIRCYLHAPAYCQHCQGSKWQW